MRRKSAIDEAKQKDRIDRARSMTPEARLQACVNLARLGVEFERTGRAVREALRQRNLSSPHQ